jgi:THAP4-like, heme-binding beta-barrel domain
MAFAIPEGLAPEVYPLAWLLGTWRGPGFLAYPAIPERPFVQEVTFAHDGGPYLTYTSTIRLLDEVGADEGDDDGAPAAPATDESPDAAAPAPAPAATEVRYVPGTVWSAESGYWRVVPGQQPASSGPAGAVPPTEIEVLLAEPSGHVSVYLGAVQGPRIEIATDLVARTATAADVSAVTRMYGLVGGELMWAMDMAAFGHEMQSYASARLARQDDSADAGSHADAGSGSGAP